MEPTTKKRKLAPKVELAPQPVQPYAQPVHYHEAPHPPYPAESLPERQDFEAFARHLQDAALLIQRQTERPTYAEVSVLLLRWEDDVSVEGDLVALERVLQKEYRFKTQRWHIPTVGNPVGKLGVQIGSFLDDARPNHLLIIYYAGHGFVSPDGYLYWACNSHEESPKVKWDGVRCLFENADPDMVLFLDTACLPDPPATGSHGTKQAIGAYTVNDGRDDKGRSFTLNLVDALYRLAGGRPFSVQRLCDEIASQKQLQSPVTPQTANGAARVLTRNPVFFTLHPGKFQVTLAPLRPEAGESGRLDSLIDPTSVEDLRFEGHRVLVCTTFVGEASADMDYFHQWLRGAPLLRGKIAVEGMFLGPPTMLLISMPLPIWGIIEHSKVCCFLGYVSSHNMLHVYERLVGPSGIRPSKEVEDGRILLEARESARQRPWAQPPPEQPFRKKDDAPSAEMRKAAEGLKALSHVLPGRSEDPSPTGLVRQRTILPDSPNTAFSPQSTEDFKNPRMKIPQPPSKQESRCSHCSHAPFKDSSSLRKHIAAAHTRPFPCAFSFAGCTSAFGSKNEWKRHISSQHLCLTYYRCSECSPSGPDSKSSEFNRKDLFTQHLRRMHASHHVKRALGKGDSKLLTDWEAHVRDMQNDCLVTRRKPPQKSACPKPECQSAFEGPNAWDEWTEHVGRHMEKGEAGRMGVDSLLAQWALEEGIITGTEGGYRLTGGGEREGKMKEES